MIATKEISWTVGSQEFSGHAFWSGAEIKPAVMVCHAWGGQGDFDLNRARALAELGYVGVAIDVYGRGRRGQSTDECQALMTPLMEDRALLLSRLTAAVEACAALPNVDSKKMAAIGFCFGGLCALDLARGGAHLRGVAAFHGLLGGNSLDKKPIQAKVLAMHGYDDPMCPPEALVAFCNEMTEAGADWQVHAYGGTMHAFTNPAANDPGFGTVYKKSSDQRSAIAMQNFLAEVFAD